MGKQYKGTDWSVSDHFLQALERRELHDVLGWLGSEPLLFTRERVGTEATLGCGLAVLANLQETRNGEGTWATTADVLLDQA